MKKLLGILISCSLLLSACKPNEIRLAKHCVSSTVLVHVKVTAKIDKEEKTGWGLCSGVYVSPNTILTAAHCTGVYDADIKLKEVWVRNIYDDSAKAVVVRLDRTKDLALLKTTLRGTPVRVARKVRVGEDCWIVGNPLGLSFVVSKGIVSSINVETVFFPIDHFITDAVVLPGSSGGPAFNSKGQLIGIVVMTTSQLGKLGASGFGFVVQVNEILEFLK